MSLVLERRVSPGLVFAGIALLGVFWGFVVALAGLNALYLCAALVGCAFILLDFRIGVVLLILLMPISSSRFFPHAMLGITGATRLGDLYELQRDQLADGRRDATPVNAVMLEVVVGNRQITVVSTAVVCELDLDTVEDIAGGRA